LLRYNSQFARARELLTTLEISGTLKNDMMVVAKAKYEMAMVHLHMENQPIFEMYMQQAETLFSALHMEHWLAQIAVDRAAEWVMRGESAQALQWCLLAMQHQKRANHTTLLIDAAIYHVKLTAYTQLFQIELGHEAYQHAKVCFEQLQMPQKLLHVEIGRMLLCIQAEQYSEAFGTYECILRMIPKSIDAEQVLWFADVVVVYLCEVRAFDVAFELSYLINRMRNLLQLPQPMFLHVMVEQRKKSYEVEMMSAFSIRDVITQEISMHELLAYIRRAMQESSTTVTK
jgi:tetratricopeptide (TPR) repeat protein